MIKKYIFGHPFDTEAVLKKIEASEGLPAYGQISLTEGFHFTYVMEEDDQVYGLGEANRGINKRGYHYINDCFDCPNHTEHLTSMYGAHNFILVSGHETFGMFLDYPTKMEFDIGYSRQDTMTISCERADLVIYIIEGESLLDIVKQFRQIIGRSYIPPKFAFGYGQSRWGYTTAEDFQKVVSGYRDNHVPMDMLYMDIDYMDEYKDFTVNPRNFPDFKAFVDSMKAQKIHLVPIIDAGVKIREGYDVYEEGKVKGYFCKRADGSDFEVAVWPGYTHFPDVLNPEARAWFGEKYSRLIEAGVDGFWNDMNEPAIFYTREGLAELMETCRQVLAADAASSGTANEDAGFPHSVIADKALSRSNNKEDFKRFYHNVGGEMVCHADVHNLFGYNMTRAAGEAFEKISPDKRILIFSRSSYIGMHRYGGIWTGDNMSWWSHILLNLKMLPSLNMCGFLYCGADLGGFGADTTRDLLLRWLALGVFTPLMRNHSAKGTREQEVYQFEKIEDFRHVIGVRYRLLPYIYSTFMKAALKDDMIFKPLAFEYPDDKRARKIEDQMMMGDELMIAPVYTQNADGRYVYLPEDMLFVKFTKEGIKSEFLSKGDHFVEIGLTEVPLFIRKGRCIPVVDAAEYVDEIDMTTMTYLGFDGADYELYEDDGISRLEV